MHTWKKRVTAWAGLLLAGIVLGLGGWSPSALAGTKLHTYETLGVRFSLSLDLVPSKVLRADCADYLWPAMSDPQLGLILYRVARSEEGPAAVVAHQRERFFEARGTAVPWKTLPFLGTPVIVEKQTLGAPSANVLYSSLVPMDRYWLFVGMNFERRVPARVVERTWSELSRSLRVARKP